MLGANFHILFYSVKYEKILIAKKKFSKTPFFEPGGPYIGGIGGKVYARNHFFYFFK